MINKVLRAITFRLLCKSRILLYRLLSSSRIDGKIILNQPVLALGLGRIVVGNSVNLGFFPSPHFFSTYAHLEARQSDALIAIGDNAYINNGFVAIAEQTQIIIGRNCYLGTKVEIYDSDFHALGPEDRLNGTKPSAQEVRIGNHVFIGSNVKILKGVTVGDGVVIANGSIVTRDIPENSIAAGIPATVIKNI